METVTVEIPPIYVDCPHCKKETEVGRAWTSEDQVNVDEGDNGVVICEKCDKQFRVHLEF